MNIALVDVDGHNFPNFALMRIAAWHKAQGDNVEWYSPLFSNPDRIYASKVFTFTPDYVDFNPAHPEPIKGGTGYRNYKNLPDEIDRMLPDYSIYPQYDFALGFLSRGCIRNCPWCVVPRKEGKLRQYDDIERIAQYRKKIILMDNNFLANDFEFVKEQLEKSIYLGLKIDFNQGLDARLINPENAALLAKIKWTNFKGGGGYIRFACDTQAMLEPMKNAVTLMRKAGYKKDIFVYVLAKDMEETLERLRKLTEIDKKIVPQVQPFRNLETDGEVINNDLKRLARWANRQWIRKSCDFKDYKG